MTAVADAPAETEHEELVASFREMFEGAYGRGAARQALDGTRAGRDAWTALAAEYSLLGLDVREDLGGQGVSFVYASLAARAAGSLVLPAPWSTAMNSALHVLVRCADDALLAERVPDLLGGEHLLVAAGLGAGLAGTSSGLRLAAHGTVSGTAAHVQFGTEADAFLVAVRTEAGPAAVALVSADAPGVDLRAQEVVDPTRPQHRLTLDATPCTPLAGGDALARGLAEATILAASEAVGGARAAVNAALAYVAVRRQFGRPVGAFQALQHSLVDLFADVETAEATVDWAAALVDTAPVPDRVVLRAASEAKALASRTYARVADEALHAHGGIGFTWEHDAQLHLKRALTDRSVLGSPAQHLRLVAGALDHEVRGNGTTHPDPSED